MREKGRRAVPDRNTTLHIQGIRLIVAGKQEAGSPTHLDLPPGTLTVVMGSNGAGKTTWLEKLAGLRDPEGLAIRYGSHPLWLRRKMRPGRRLNPKALLSYGYAVQSPEQALFARSVEEELSFSLRPYSSGLTEADMLEAKAAALDAVGLNPSWLQRDPFRMSGGERRRTALASLFATPSAWLLLDEPTAGLDQGGHERLAEHLELVKSEGRGIVLVSHDSDWALPIADRVLLLYVSGEFRSCHPHDLVRHPEWLREAGMQVPEWLQLAQAAWRSGVPVERLWNPAEAAGWIAGQENVLGKHVEVEALTADTAVAKRPHNGSAHRLTRFDPRAVWLGYALLTAGLFSLTTWQGLAAGTAIVLGLLFAGNVSLMRWRVVIGGFVYFALAMSCFTAVITTGDGRLWDTEAFTGTLFPLTRTLLVLLIGLGIPLVMTPLSLRRSLEQLVSWRGKTNVFWQRVILTVTLLIRFVPVLLSEWERFSRIFLARGKETGKTPRVLIRKVRGVTIPFLLALFRLGDDVVTALESRGVRNHVIPTRGSRLKWKWPDTALIAGMAVLSGVLFVLR